MDIFSLVSASNPVSQKTWQLTPDRIFFHGDPELGIYPLQRYCVVVLHGHLASMLGETETDQDNCTDSWHTRRRTLLGSAQ